MRAILLGLIVLFSASALQSQVFDPIPYDYTSSMISWQNHDRLSVHTYKQGKDGDTDAVPQDTPVNLLKEPIDPAKLLFEYSPVRTEANVARLIDAYDSAIPGTKVNLKVILTPKTMAAVHKYCERMGLRADNIADAFALYLVWTWSSVQDPQGPIADTQYQAVAIQTRNWFRHSATLNSMTDAEKQAFAEQAIVIALLNSIIPQDAGGRDMAMASGRSMGFDMARLTITSRGFEAIQ